MSVVMVTTDGSRQQEWQYGYRENDQLGGNDPYSASKAAAELAITSWAPAFAVNTNIKRSTLKSRLQGLAM